MLGNTNMAGINVAPSQISVVGLEAEQKIIKEQLTQEKGHRRLVSIVGMGGIGKTTIATKLYQELENHFHKRAFCCVSQTYDKRKLLLEILSQVTKLPDQAEEKIFDDLGDMLGKALKKRRYLLVMDDMWDIGAWKDLNAFLPDDCKGSRILITSRQNDVVSQVNECRTFSHALRLLSEEESWELLEAEVFHQGRCPPDLLDLGRKIAKSCQGLPLAIVAIAGILKSNGQEREKWETIAAESVSTHAQIECSHKFELSYQYLPEQLKPCFLYLAAFQEDFRIPAQKLIQLWIAEGFIEPETENQHPEDLAKDYLKGLVGRNLVMVSEMRSIGGIKKCHLHDLMLEFCLQKARQEKLMQRFQGDNWLSAFGSTDVSNPRLCYYCKGESLELSKFLSSSHLSSLLLFVFDEYRMGSDCTFISGLERLTVLELAGLRVNENFFDMKLPAELRYLAVCGEFREIPASISRLSELETLIVDNDRVPGVIRLPDSIWEMVKLKHLRGKAHFLLREPRGRKLENLQTLNFHCVGEDRNQALEAVPNLRNLKCYFLPLSHLPPLGFPPQLESLHLHWEDFVELSKSDLGRLPSNLRKLTITGGLFCENICGLPNLEVLKIRLADFAEKKWRMTDDENFPKLKYLKLIASNIEIWDASRENFPCLETLVLDLCYKLKRIPSNFEKILTWKLIDVRKQWFNESVVTSAKEIQNKQKEYGNWELVVKVP